MLLSLGLVRFMSEDLAGSDLELEKTSYLCTLEGCAARVDLVSLGCTTWLQGRSRDNPPTVKSDEV